MKYLAPFLQCPVCQNPLANLQCGSCNSAYFTADGIPCIFTAQAVQREAWQHQAFLLREQSQQSLRYLEGQLARPDISALTTLRLTERLEYVKQSSHALLHLLREGGLEPKQSPNFKSQNLGDIAEYYHHILRDWAWDDAWSDDVDGGKSDSYVTSINNDNLARIQQMPNCPTQGDTLFLGAGAGRLSFDVHRHKSEGASVAMDINPLLLLAANSLIKKQAGFDIGETVNYPQFGFDAVKLWPLSPPVASDKAKTWLPLLADIWQNPFQAQSFDHVISSWFIDVCGGDVRELIGAISRWLKPRGTWINTGPLLYTGNTPPDCCYSHEEILEFLMLSGFEVLDQQLDTVSHLGSPLNAREQIEQVWTFSAKLISPGDAEQQDSNDTPAWLVLHYLPVPLVENLPQEVDDFTQALLALIDGNRSVNDLASYLAPGNANITELKPKILAALALALG